MSAQYIYMNGVAFNPTSVETEVEKIGESRRMVDATLRYYHRAFKSKWTITWNALPESKFAAIQTIGLLTTSFTFIDYASVSHTVMVLPGGFKHTIDATSVDHAGIKRYTITLTLDEV